jgi:hypothetical protein
LPDGCASEPVESSVMERVFYVKCAWGRYVMPALRLLRINSGGHPGSFYR